MDWAIFYLLFVAGVVWGWLSRIWWQRRSAKRQFAAPFAAPGPFGKEDDQLEDLVRYARGIDARLDALIAHMGFKLTYREPQRVQGKWVVEFTDVESSSMPEGPTGPTA